MRQYSLGNSPVWTSGKTQKSLTPLLSIRCLVFSNSLQKNSPNYSTSRLSVATSLPLREDRFLLPSHPSTGLVLPTLRRATPGRPWMLCSRRDHCCLSSPAPVGDSPNLSQCSHSLGTVLRGLPDLCARGSLAAGMLQFGTRWAGGAPTGRNNAQLRGATDSRESGRG